MTNAAADELVLALRSMLRIFDQTRALKACEMLGHGRNVGSDGLGKFATTFGPFLKHLDDEKPRETDRQGT